ncbi:E3 ubiquitin- ligase [Lecanosticta acicola]|uniref:RBR-type E3 ubiquitin transferase n=1 Tax=Lecanosticta acicola TaxID=111012 RepID=A0AAI8Z942_9PEZI|nr:E3 ubiquitin- ligase [Lecanosticta acicola]
MAVMMSVAMEYAYAGKLKRSNAKLKKKGQTLGIAATMSPAIDGPPAKTTSKFSLPSRTIPDDEVRPPGFPGPSSSKTNSPGPSRSRLSKPFRTKSGSSSTTLFASEPPDVPNADYSSVMEMRHKKKSIFSKLTRKFGKGVSKANQSPPRDHFIMRGDELMVDGRYDRYGLPVHPANIRRVRDNHTLEPQPSSPVYSNPYGEAALAQDMWGRRRMDSASSDLLLLEDDQSIQSEGSHPDPGPMPSIRGLDWDAMTETQLRAVIDIWDLIQPDLASPTDSGIELGHEPPTVYEGKGKARAMDTNDGVDFSHIDAQTVALAIDVEREEQAREERLQKLKTRDQAIALQRQEYLEQMFQLERDQIETQRLQDEEERLAAELASQRTCICCGDSKHPLDFPAKPPTAQCEHPSRTCFECMHSWLASELDSNGSENIKCAECPQVLAFGDVRRLATESTFTAYETLITRNALSSLPEFAWCLSPTCTSGQLNNSADGSENDRENYMHCVACGYKQCLHHRVPWHTGETCTQYTYRTSGQKSRDEEAATRAIIDSISKKCPGPNCGWRIQKIDGCDHMTCKKCRFEFCWECLASHREIRNVGNTAHEAWCKFHSDNLKLAWPFNVHG